MLSHLESCREAIGLSPLLNVSYCSFLCIYVDYWGGYIKTAD